ncbi:class I SAM-dependent methyltransferase [Indiicoccus explosivorum]|uniref:class I SAM-dependent methyltransferase n=1 Tax=Indiicoccus explosivorum TaxID=1917864 RepID=UPI000B42E8AC|nr:methyltransferase domain-containing protein [Indiicoccus explosivorum]
MELSAKDKVKKVFGKNADAYVKSSNHAMGDDLPLLVEWLQPEKSWTILDIATGGGHVARMLAPFVKTAVATDLTEQMLSNTALYLSGIFDNILFAVADAEELPFLANTFDAVTCRIASHHFPNPGKFISEVARVLKPGGKFVLIDSIAPEDPELAAFINEIEKLRDDSYVRCLSKAEWRHHLLGNRLVEKDSADRRQTYDYEGWVARTAENEEQIGRVTHHLLFTNERTATYFGITADGGKIQHFTQDEWMVMCEKQTE